MNRRGQGLVEVTLDIALVAIVTIAVMRDTGTQVKCVIYIAKAGATGGYKIRDALNSRAGDANYAAGWDSDEDGDIDALDYSRFIALRFQCPWIAAFQ